MEATFDRLAMCRKELVVLLSLVYCTPVASTVSHRPASCTRQTDYCLPKNSSFAFLCSERPSSKDDGRLLQPSVVKKLKVISLCSLQPQKQFRLPRSSSAKIQTLAATRNNSVGFRCRPFHLLPTCQRVVYFHLVSALTIPTVSLKYQGGTRIGDRAFLTCIVTWANATVIQRVRFKKDDEVLIEQTNIRKQKGSSFKNMIFFNSLTHQDAGLYECSAKSLPSRGSSSVYVYDKFTLEVQSQQVIKTSAPNLTSSHNASSPSYSAPSVPTVTSSSSQEGWQIWSQSVSTSLPIVVTLQRESPPDVWCTCNFSSQVPSRPTERQITQFREVVKISGGQKLLTFSLTTFVICMIFVLVVFFIVHSYLTK